MTLSRSESSVFRFLLVGLVVLNHTDRSEGLLFPFTSPAFAFISGLFFFQSFHSPALKAKKIFSGLVVPYLVWNSIYYVIYGFGKPILVSLNRGDAFKRLPPIFSIEGFINALAIQPINGPFWYLRELILCGVIATIVLGLVKNKWVLLLITTCVIFIFCKQRFYAGFFVGLSVGLLDKNNFVNQALSRLIKNNRVIWMIIVGVLLALLCAGLGVGKSHFCLFNILAGFFYSLVAILVGPIISPKLCGSIERFSFIIFASHALFIGIFRVLFMARGLGDGSVSFYLGCAVFVVFGAQSISVLSSYFRLDRWLVGASRSVSNPGNN